MVNDSPKFKVGKNCKIASTAIIHDNVVLGDNCSIGEYAVLGVQPKNTTTDPLVIGENSTIRSHCVLYQGSKFGRDLNVGHHTMIREGIKAGVNLQVGSFNDIEGDATFGNWVRFHSNVHVGRGSKIGDLVWLFPYVVLTNDPIPPSGLKYGATLSDGVVVCTAAIILPGADLDVGAFIAASAKVGGNVDKGALVVGERGKTIGDVRKLKHMETNKQHPWMNHFSNHYPEEAQNKIREIQQILSNHFESSFKN